MPRLTFAFACVWLASFAACSSTSGDGDDGGSSGGGSAGSSGGGKSSGGTDGSGGLSGGSAGEGGTATSGGSGGVASGGTSGSGTTSGSGGTAPSCVTDTVVLGQSPTSECGYDIPEGVEDFDVNVYYGSSVGSGTLVCRRASSQGCTPHGWWINGGQVLLCDETCGAFADNAGQVLYIEVGCESDACL
jgi:hypothetical protein